MNTAWKKCLLDSPETECDGSCRDEFIGQGETL